MDTMIELCGHPTWTTVRGEGPETVVLLHGGLSNSDAILDAIGGALGERYRVAAFDRRGHGRTADTDAPFHYEDMADQTIAFLEHLGTSCHLVGWSDGGIIALLVARRRPDLVGRSVVIGANFHASGILPIHLEPGGEMATMMATQYVERSPDGADHLAVVFEKSFAMFAAEPDLTTDDLREIAVPVLVLVGDDDLIDLGHTCALYESIPGAQLAVVPGASHALPVEHPDETARIVLRFLAAPLPPVTMMPVRRA